MKKTVLYLGHFYHEKTKSTLFLKNILETRYQVEYATYDPYTGIYHLSNEEHKVYDYLLCFQVMPERRNLDDLCLFGKGILFPMYDAAVDASDKVWEDYKDFLIISFSKKLSDKLSGKGLETKYIQFFLKPYKLNNMGSEEAIFLWQRREDINLNTVEKLFPNRNVSKIYLHLSMDPEQQYKEIYNSLSNKVEKSTWFETKEEMLTRIENAAFYIAPRKYEGIGMSFLEAMAMGRCVIAPNEATMNEYIKDGVNGILYDIDNVEPIQINDIKTIQKNAYETAEIGYKKWMEEREQILNWIEEKRVCPMISVITIIDNDILCGNKVTVKQCIESVHRQTYESIEHIVVNLSDSQEMNLILSRYEDMGWITLCKTNKKEKFAIYKEIINYVKGFYISFLEENSFYEENNSLETYIRKLQQENSHFVYSDNCICNLKGINEGTEISVIESFFAVAPFDYQAGVYRKDILLELNEWSGNYTEAGQFELLNLLILRGYRYTYVTEGLISIRRNDDIDWNKVEDEKIQRMEICSKNYGLPIEEFQVVLHKLVYENDCRKDLFRHIRACAKSNIRDRMQLAVACEDKDNYHLLTKKVTNEFKRDESPLITIVTVTYNVLDAGRRDTFMQCLDSIHNQTYKNIEHLIIDGDSRDGTLEVIRMYHGKKKIRILTEPDENVWDAMRKAVYLAKGKYINYLNTDDFFSTDYSVEKAVKCLEEQNGDYFYSLANRIAQDESTDILTPIDINYYGNENTVWWGKGMCHQSMFVKTNVIKELDTFNSNIKISLDNYQMLQLVVKKKKAVYLPEPIVTFRMGGISAVEDVQEVFASYFYDCIGKEYGMSFDECKNLWLLKCIDECDILYNLSILCKLKRTDWRTYFYNKLNQKKFSKSETSVVFDELREQNEYFKIRSNKMSEYFHLLNMWMKKEQLHLDISAYLKKKNIHKIAIYGAGELGNRLYEKIEKSDIEVTYIIDGNEKKKFHNIPVVNISPRLEKVDVIIVTPINEYEIIRTDINKYSDINVISLKELIEAI